MTLSKLASLIPGIMLSTAALAQIDATIGGATTPADFGTRYVLNAANTANLAFITGPGGSGRTVLSSKVLDAQASVAGIKRTDFYPVNETRASGLRWYAISVYFPSAWVAHPYPAVVAQMASTTGASTWSAPLSLLVRGAALEMNLNSNFRTGDAATTASNTTEVIKLGPLVKQKWYCLVIRSDWSPTLGSGAVTMWMNGEKVYNAQNSTNSYFGSANVPHAGLMFPGLMGVSERTVYTDFIRLGGAASTALTMYGATPCSSFVTGPTIQW